jgi:hypothetical protein
MSAPYMGPSPLDVRPAHLAAITPLMGAPIHFMTSFPTHPRAVLRARIVASAQSDDASFTRTPEFDA